ncbi:MAG: ABC transporter substrate-binding protein, partial [Patescibacteria group bacterium]
MPVASSLFTAQVAAAIKNLDRRRKFWIVILTAIFLLAVAGFIWQANVASLIELPANGGELKEGVIGPPRFVNPLLAVSNSDRDLTALIYSGLLRSDETGSLRPDLAERYVVSADGKEYRFFLKPNLVWHDGKAVIADDVLFTIESAKNPSLKSPRRAAWEGVEVTKINDQEIRFTLKQPYALFLENATLGILPAHLWRNLTAENFPFSNFNLEAVGTGPYQIKNIGRDRNNLPLIYNLVAFKNFALSEVKLKRLTINFYPNEDELWTAYQKGSIDSLSAVSPARVKETTNDDSILVATPLARIFAVFFNQNRSKIFAQTEVREALND